MKMAAKIAKVNLIFSFMNKHTEVFVQFRQRHCLCLFYLAALTLVPSFVAFLLRLEDPNILIGEKKGSEES